MRPLGLGLSLRQRAGIEAWMASKGAPGADMLADFAGQRYGIRSGGVLREGSLADLTFLRASEAGRWPASGPYGLVGNNVARFDHDPVSRLPLGIRMEGARANFLRNNTMVGAVVGSPGTLPQYWNYSQNTGIVPAVVGLGVEDGINYIDLRWVGTSAGGLDNNIFFGTNTESLAANGQTWTSSFYVAMIAGSKANVTAINHQVQENTSGGTLVTSGGSDINSQVQAGALKNTRSIVTKAFVGGATVAATRNAIQLRTSAGPVDITLRIGLPQLELSAYASSPIKTSGTVMTRASERLYYDMPDPAVTGFTLALRLRSPAVADAAGSMLFMLWNGISSTNRFQALGSTSSIITQGLGTFGSSPVSILSGAFVPNADERLVFSVSAAGAVKVTRNGGPILSGSLTGAFPGGMTRLDLMTFNGSIPWFGTCYAAAAWMGTPFNDNELMGLLAA